jgi:hypothetical protein
MSWIVLSIGTAKVKRCDIPNVSRENGPAANPLSRNCNFDVVHPHLNMVLTVALPMRYPEG